MRLDYAAASDVGLVRKGNEDSFVSGPHLFAVCDGMGGAQAGEVASEAACRRLLELSPSATEDELRRAVEEANAHVLRAARLERGLAGMGTTLTAALTAPDGASATIAHVGDSRAYLWHDGQLRQLTDDHSLVAEMVRQGRLTAEEAAVHPHRSVITRALGTESVVQVDMVHTSLEPGDRLLICSDGLSGMVSDEEISRMLGEGREAGAVTKSLVAAALAAGGEDNVTVVVVLVEEGEGRPDERPCEVGPSQREPVRRGGVSGYLQRVAPRRPFGARGAPPAAGGGGGRFSRRRVLIVLIVLAVLAGLAVGLFAAFNSSVYHVGVYGGKVALFQGMPHSVLGIQLYRLVEEGPVLYEQLDEYVKRRVDSRELTTKEEGQQFIRNLINAD